MSKHIKDFEGPLGAYRDFDYKVSTKHFQPRLSSSSSSSEDNIAELNEIGRTSLTPSALSSSGHTNIIRTSEATSSTVAKSNYNSSTTRTESKGRGNEKGIMKAKNQSCQLTFYDDGKGVNPLTTFPDTRLRRDHVRLVQGKIVRPGQLQDRAIQKFDFT